MLTRPWSADFHQTESGVARVTAYGWVRPGGSAFRRNADAYFPQALLVGLMLILALSCLAATRSYSMFALMSARMIGALAHGAFWA